jgi:proline-rich protein PRCC
MLVDYGSDDDSGGDAGPSPSLSKSSIATPFTSKPTTQAAPLPTSASSSGFQLPPPKSNSRRRDGPVKIKVEAPKPSSEYDAPIILKKQRVDQSSVRTTGAGASSLLSMLPAPKMVQKTSVAPAKSTRVLGGGVKSNNDDPGVIMASDFVTTSEADSSNPKAEDSTLATSFMPSSIARNTPKVLPKQSSTGSKLPAPATDFFSLGAFKSPIFRVPGVVTIFLKVP